MGPLLLVNWRAVNRRFCLLLWLVAAVLMSVILIHLAHASAACGGPPSKATPSVRYAPRASCADQRATASRAR